MVHKKNLQQPEGQILASRKRQLPVCIALSEREGGRERARHRENENIHDKTFMFMIKKVLFYNLSYITFSPQDICIGRSVDVLSPDVISGK